MKCASGSMDRASDSGSEGWGFESLLAYQTEQIRTLQRCSSSAVCLVFVSPDFDAEEMQILIEAAVAEFNEAFKKPLTAESTADAVRRVEATITE